jgi:hypothetical protein
MDDVRLEKTTFEFSQEGNYIDGGIETLNRS